MLARTLAQLITMGRSEHPRGKHSKIVVETPDRKLFHVGDVLYENSARTTDDGIFVIQLDEEYPNG